MSTVAAVASFTNRLALTTTQGISGYFPNVSSQFRHTFSASMPTSIQVSASSSSSSSPIIDEKTGAGFDDLLIVGPGVLGRLVAQKWRQEHEGCEIYGQTVTVDHHEELIKAGINPCLKGTELDHKFPDAIFCAPPSGSLDYPGDIRVAALNWNGEGSFCLRQALQCLIAATMVLVMSVLCFVLQDTPVVPIGRSPKNDILLHAEKVVLEFGGVVLRLAGLYKADRGAHVYWLSKGTVDANPDHVLNLIHYEDAASLSVAIMKKRLRSRILLGCDNHPLSRKEVMELVNKSGKFTEVFDSFTITDEVQELHQRAEIVSVTRNVQVLCQAVNRKRYTVVLVFIVVVVVMAVLAAQPRRGRLAVYRCYRSFQPFF